MLPNELNYLFDNSNSNRQGSVVYGSTGKCGLLVTSDFVKLDSNYPDELLDDEREISCPSNGKETNSLLTKFCKTRNNSHKNSVLAEGPVDREISLLNDNGIKIPYQRDENESMENFSRSLRRYADSHALTELKLIFFASVPLTITFLLQCSFSTVSVFAAGYLGTVELAALSISSLMVSITGYAIIQGISSALDTLCPQAFGAKKYHLVGDYMQKCVAINFTIMMPILLIWVFFGFEIITPFLSDKDSATYAATYLRYTAPGIPAYILFECGKRFLQAQGIYHVSTIVLIFAAPSNLVMTLFLVKTIGYVGIPIATSVNYWLMAFGLFSYIVFIIEPHRTPSGQHPLVCWNGFHIKDALKSWGKIFYLAVPGLVILEAKFFALEIFTLMASHMGTVALAAQSVGTAISSLAYQVLFAIGIASSTRIAKFLGAGLNSPAKITTQVSLCFGFALSSMNVLLLYSFKTRIILLFTKDDKVIRTVSGITWLIALMQVCDSMNVVSAGSLRGQGQIKIGSIITLLSYYLIGIPLSLYLTFYSELKGTIEGLWVGSCAALIIISTVQSYYALFADFEELCREARKRTSK